jgi:hypothetical protein
LLTRALWSADQAKKIIRHRFTLITQFDISHLLALKNADQKFLGNSLIRWDRLVLSKKLLYHARHLHCHSREQRLND